MSGCNSKDGVRILLLVTSSTHIRQAGRIHGYHRKVDWLMARHVLTQFGDVR